MKKHWKTPRDAEAYYFNDSLPALAASESQDFSGLPEEGSVEHSPPPTEATPMNTPDISSFLTLLNQLSGSDQLRMLSKLFTRIVSDHFKMSVPDDFLVLSAKAMDYLKCNYKSNVLYSLAKGIGTMREDETESRFPTKRMPMGLVEYAANFYAADNLQLVRVFLFSCI